MTTFDFDRFYIEVLIPYLEGAPRHLMKEEASQMGVSLSEGLLSYYGTSLAKLQRYQGASLDVLPKSALIATALELVGVVSKLVLSGVVFPEGTLGYKVLHFEGGLPGLEVSHTRVPYCRKIAYVKGGKVVEDTFSSTTSLLGGVPVASREVASIPGVPSMANILSCFLKEA